MLVEIEHNVVNVFNVKKLNEIHIEEIWISSNLKKKIPSSQRSMRQEELVDIVVF
jgi:hypothetical protein